MMFLNEAQRTFLQSRAAWVRAELKIKEGLWRDDQIVTNWLAEQLQESCEMGYSIAQQEVRSTPWEFVWCSLNSERMNELSAEGWELIHVVGVDAPVLIWRRYRAVSGLEAKET